MKNVNCNPDSMEGADEITKKKRPRKDQNMVQTIYCGTCSGDASLRSIREAINDLELLTVKDLSEVSSESAMQSRLDHLLVLLSTSSHPEVTVEVKEAIVEFKTKASATVESVNKLKNFEKHRATIQRKTVTRVTGKGRRIDLKNSKKKVSGAMKADYKRKKELEAEIETLKKQLAAKEMDLEQLVLNLKNREAKLSTCSMNCASLKEQARKLLKEADDLLTE
ncbi:disease resistance protein [Sesbania bispinosa]|nr:disease resistance protein [Sesbania bispinosa]